MSTDSMRAAASGPTLDDDAREGTVLNPQGGDWDDLVGELTSTPQERIVVNMGPQHPSTHLSLIHI